LTTDASAGKAARLSTGLSVGPGRIGPGKGDDPVTLSFGSRQIIIYCDQHIGQNLLAIYSGTGVPVSMDEGENPQSALAVYHVRRDFTDSNGRPIYRITGNGRTLCHSETADGLLPFLEWSITDAARSSLPGYQLFHAGAVVRNGHGILLPGPSAAGKSSVVAALTLHGFEYCSDELAVVGPDARLHPFPKIISLKSGGWGQVVRQFPNAVSEAGWPDAFGGGLWYLKPPSLPDPSGMCCGYPIDLVLIPRYEPSQSTKLTPISRSQALKELVDQSMGPWLPGSHRLDLLVRVVGGAQCYSLTSNDLGKVVELVESLTK